MEYGGYDLSKIIKHCRKLAGWSVLHVQFISWHILAALNYLHSANITHRVGHRGWSSISDDIFAWGGLDTVACRAPRPDISPTALTVDACAGPEAKQHSGHRRQPCIVDWFRTCGGLQAARTRVDKSCLHCLGRG